jgi:protoporphyrinogen oxidase
MSDTDVDASDHDVVIIGAGPAGLTAAYELVKRGVRSTVLESDDVVGGISRTVERDGYRFDIGGHRFFTKVEPVERLWHEILTDDEFLLRPRMSRVFYDGKYFDYPLKATNVLRNVGIVEAVLCVLSYLWARIRPPKDQTNLEGWVAARFGWRLYRTFFKTYNEKLWGVPATEIQADWAAQRIKNLSLFKAAVNMLDPRKNQTNVTSLIEEFQYPMYGPGMMWERCTELVEAEGTKVLMEHRVVGIKRDVDAQRAVAVVAESGGSTTDYPSTDVISSMPLSSLVRAMDPPAPEPVHRCAEDIRYRDFLMVALVVPERVGFPDNWIYVHDPNVRMGRIQNFGSWSPYMVKDGNTCLGCEFFVTVGDEMWTMDDEGLITLATRELERLGLAVPSDVQAGYVVRMKKAYPMYDEFYQRNVAVLREWLDEHVPNVHPIGRNGMFRYNNQDHSMYTAMLTVENILDGTDHDVWEVNVEEEYHEEMAGDSPTAAERRSGAGTGRDAPIIPRQAFERGGGSPTDTPTS